MILVKYLFQILLYQDRRRVSLGARLDRLSCKLIILAIITKSVKCTIGPRRAVKDKHHESLMFDLAKEAHHLGTI